MPTVPVEYTPEVLGAVLGTVFSLAFLLIPKLNVWFAQQEKETKQSIMAIATIVIGLVVYAVACLPALGFTLVACPVGGFQTALLVIVATVIANQSVYRIIPEPKAVKQMKAFVKAKELAKTTSPLPPLPSK